MSTRSPQGALTATMRKRLAKYRRTGEDVSPEQLAFRRAAAVLPEFDPAELRPAGAADGGTALFYLFRDSTVQGESGASFWSLNPEVRLRTLRSFKDPKEALEALDTNSELASQGFAKVFGDYLRTGVPPLADQKRDQLRQTLKAVRWLSQIPGTEDLPSEEEVFAELERKSVFEPFEKLIERGVFGRSQELDELRNFVGVLEAEQLRGRLARLGTGVARMFTHGTAPPLLISGPGGIGKSTLIAKFIVDHIGPTSRQRLPFAYLDFERALVTALEPLTLLIEACRQLKSQYPRHSSRFAELEARCRAETERQARADDKMLSLGQRSYKPEEAEERARSLRANRKRRERRLVKAFSKLVMRASGRRTDDLELGESERDREGEDFESRPAIRIEAENTSDPHEIVEWASRVLGVDLKVPMDDMEEARWMRHAAVWLINALEMRKKTRLVLEGYKDLALTSEVEDFIVALAEALDDRRSEVTLVLRDYGGRLPKHLRGSKKVITETSEIEPVPFLVVLDSFERTQHRSYLHLSRLWTFFEVLQASYPLLRVVVSGRAPVEGLRLKKQAARHMRLKELADEHAVALLASRSEFDEDTARRLVGLYGGNPLTLRLLARLGDAQLEVSNSGSGETGRRWWQWSDKEVDDAVVQAMLYERILGQIDDPAVRKLAHPGLVLRRITPEIIEKILAPFCELRVGGRDQADALFLALERQVDLVEVLRPGVLGHRPEIRAVMLGLLEKDKGPMVKKIERAAVEYYSMKSAPEERAEEIYHRLRLGEPPDEIKSLWMAGLERFFREDDVNEVPKEARPFLSSRISGLAAPGEAKSAFDKEYIEQAAAVQANDLLTEGLAKEALELVEGISEWSEASPLFALKASALSALGDLAGAGSALAEGISSAETYVRLVPDPEPRRTLLTLRTLAAGYASAANDHVVAEQHLAEAQRWAVELEDRVELLRTLGSRLRARRMAKVPEAENKEIRRRLENLFLELEASELDFDPALIASIGIELGEMSSKPLVKAISLLDWADFRVTRSTLAGQLAQEAADSKSLRSWLLDFVRRNGFIVESLDEESIAAFLEGIVKDGKMARLLSELVDHSEDGSSVRRAVVKEIESLGDRFDAVEKNPVVTANVN